MPSPPDYVTGAEFTRWMTEHAAFRDRLERRMAENARLINDGLTRIEDHLAKLNHQTSSNTSGLASIDHQLIQIEQESAETQKLAVSIKENGCHKYLAHSQILTDLSVAGWTPKKKVAIGAGIFASGSLLWPAVQEIAKGIHTVIEWIGPR